MEGNNEIHLNGATVRTALQEYFDRRGRDGVAAFVVDSVTVNRQSGAFDLVAHTVDRPVAEVRAVVEHPIPATLCEASRPRAGGMDKNVADQIIHLARSVGWNAEVDQHGDLRVDLDANTPWYPDPDSLDDFVRVLNATTKEVRERFTALCRKPTTSLLGHEHRDAVETLCTPVRCYWAVLYRADRECSIR